MSKRIRRRHIPEQKVALVRQHVVDLCSRLSRSNKQLEALVPAFNAHPQYSRVYVRAGCHAGPRRRC
jgi:hypothetical protein